VRLIFVGAKGEYVQGYPRRDIDIEDKAEADRLVATGCYVVAKPEAAELPEEKEVTSDG
jgi:hypothetical protein